MTDYHITERKGWFQVTRSTTRIIKGNKALGWDRKRIPARETIGFYKTREEAEFEIGRL